MPERTTIFDTCFWLADWRRRHPDHQPAAPLVGPAEADIAVLGGGFTGLWTALFLREIAPERRVVLLEAEVCGHGASGRNAGIVGESVDHSHDLAIEHFGRAEAARLVTLGRQNRAELASFAAAAAAAGEDPVFEANGQLVVALDDAQLPGLADSMATANELAREAGETDESRQWRLLDAAATRRRLDSPRYRGALVIPGNATVDPVGLVMALRAEALRQGVVIHEQSAVTAISPGRSTIEVRTAGGRLRAARAVLATNAYSHLLWPRLGRRFLPLYDYILVSEPLTAEQRARIGWAGREGVTDARTFFKYYRLTPDERILWGTSEAVYHRGDRVGPDCDHEPAVYANLRASFARHFPTLAELEFPYAWGGPIAATTRFTPFFGHAAGGQLIYGLGYTGHGVGSTRIAGRILAHLALERPSPLLDLAMVTKLPLPYPPEPLRGWAIGAVTRALRRVDAGESPGPLLRILARLGIGFSS
jgi:glycine/D-amino acid oxidase-like deaminating enzyme